MGLLSPEKIGELIRQWRADARLSQQALEAATGVGQKTLSLMERGQSLTLENVWALLRYYGKGPEALTSDTPRNAPEAPRTHPPPDPGTIPLAEHRAAVRAFMAQIEALERQQRDAAGDLHPERVERLSRVAAENATPQPAPQPAQDSADSRSPPRRGTKGRR